MRRSRSLVGVRAVGIRRRWQCPVKSLRCSSLTLREREEGLGAPVIINHQFMHKNDMGRPFFPRGTFYFFRRRRSKDTREPAELSATTISNWLSLSFSSLLLLLLSFSTHRHIIGIQKKKKTKKNEGGKKYVRSIHQGMLIGSFDISNALDDILPLLLFHFDFVCPSSVYFLYLQNMANFNHRWN